MSNEKTTDKFNPKQALRLARKLAFQAQRTIACPNVLHLSRYIEDLQTVLNEYNNYIFKYPVKDGKEYNSMYKIDKFLHNRSE